MNVADTEIVGGILTREGYEFTREISSADVILVNTCAIRDNAEQRIIGRLGYFSTFKRANPSVIVGVLGCMAERLRERLVDEQRLVDVVVGPDEYRRLPDLLRQASEGTRGIAVRLSRVENYEDILPLRTDGVSAWMSVMRGCDKFCSFCVVPFTRGRERSRSLESVVREAHDLFDRGVRDVTLLGQNVNSYRDGDNDFASLLRAVAAIDPRLRVRFTTSHPQDLSENLIRALAENENVCNHVHLPVQSGSDRILHLMNRSYTVEEYRRCADRLREALPGVSLSTDIISGFPSETIEDHRMTVRLMADLRFDGAFTFKYSAREKTRAWDLPDDVSEEIKGERVAEITALQHAIAEDINRELVGSVQEVLAEGPSRKSASEWMGRTATNKVVIFPHAAEHPGDIVCVRIERANSATLFGTPERKAAA